MTTTRATQLDEQDGFRHPPSRDGPNRRLIALAAALAILAAGLFAVSFAYGRVNPTFAGEGTWTMTEITLDGSSITPPERIDSSFQRRWFRMETGCNRIEGEFRSDASGGFTFGERISTVGGCVLPRARQEALVQDILRVVTRSDVDGDILTLRNGDGTSTLVFERAGP